MTILLELGKVILVAAVLGYVGFLVAAWRLGPQQVFPRPTPSYDQNLPDLVVLEGGPGRLAALHLPRPGARHVILYHHGNYEDLGTVLPHLERLRRAGFAVFSYDYPGYGLSEGSPSEATVVAAANRAYDYLTGTLGYPAESLVHYGRSLGGGPALALAATRPAAGVILDGTFTSAFRVLTRVKLLPFDIFDNLGLAPRLTCPVLVIHGTADRTIPPRHALKLQRALPRAELWLVEGAGHNDLPDLAGPAYDARLVAFSKALAAPSSAR